MTAEQIMQEITALPREDWIKIQNGIADLIAAEWSPEELEEIQKALSESEAEFEAGLGTDVEQVRRKFGPR